MRFVLLALLMLPVPSVSAQTMAVLQGRVIDPSGAAVPGASIRVRDPATGFAGSGQSDGDGRYHVAAHSAGDLPGHHRDRGVPHRPNRSGGPSKSAARWFAISSSRSTRSVKPWSCRPSCRCSIAPPVRSVTSCPHRPSSRSRSTAATSSISDRSCPCRSRHRRPASPPRRSAAPARSRSIPPAIAKKPSATSSTASPPTT